MDKNQKVKNLGQDASMHGMHVGGTVAANTPDQKGIKGVAPEAQLLALKVFGNNPEFESTYGDIIIAAMDDAIALSAKGIIEGKGNQLFDPEGLLTYGEFTKLLVETLDIPSEEVDGKWYVRFLNATEKQDLITEADKGKAEEHVTREEMAVILSKILKGNLLPDYKIEVPKPITFIDVEDLKTDSIEITRTLTDKGLLNGRGHQIFAPKSTLTRAEAAVVMSRVLEILYK